MFARIRKRLAATFIMIATLGTTAVNKNLIEGDLTDADYDTNSWT